MAPSSGRFPPTVFLPLSPHPRPGRRRRTEVADRERLTRRAAPGSGGGAFVALPRFFLCSRARPAADTPIRSLRSGRPGAAAGDRGARSPAAARGGAQLLARRGVRWRRGARSFALLPLLLSSPAQPSARSGHSKGRRGCVVLSAYIDPRRPLHTAALATTAGPPLRAVLFARRRSRGSSPSPASRPRPLLARGPARRAFRRGDAQLVNGGAQCNLSRLQGRRAVTHGSSANYIGRRARAAARRSGSQGRQHVRRRSARGGAACRSAEVWGSGRHLAEVPYGGKRRKLLGHGKALSGGAKHV